MKNIYLLITGLILMVASVTAMATQGYHQDTGVLFRGHNTCGDHVADYRFFGNGMGNHGPVMGFNCGDLDR